ncbi:hypothetical protein [Streptomyces nojiriensis]
MNDGPLLEPVEVDRIREGIAASVLGAGWFPWRYYKRPVAPGTEAAT